jgi:hypothetical protein
MSTQDLVAVVTLYLEVGALVALGFTLLVGRLDQAARGAFTFRPLLLPGAAMLWPLVLVRTVRALLSTARGRTP